MPKKQPTIIPLRFMRQVGLHIGYQGGIILFRGFQKLEPEQDRQTHRQMRPNVLPGRIRAW